MNRPFGRIGLYVVALLLMSTGPGDRALRPESSPEIQRLFDGMKPQLVWDDIKIHRESVDAQLCPAGAAKSECFSLQLTMPDKACAETRGPFCRTFPQGAPKTERVALVDAALKSAPADAFWSAPDVVPPVGWTERLSAIRDQLLHPAGKTLAVMLVVLPLLAGVILGAVLRLILRRRISGRMSFAVLLAFPLILGAGAASYWVRLGRWDGATEGLLLGVGLLWGLHAAFSRIQSVVIPSMALVLGVLLLEGALRLLLPPSPGFSVEETEFLLNPALHQFQPVIAGSQDHVCSIAYPGQYVSRLGATAPREPFRKTSVEQPKEPTRRVLHLGDSMTYGFGVGPDETFESGIARGDPGAAHYNAAIIGTGPDAYLVVLRSWLKRESIQLAVMYLFEGNDFSEIDKGHQCSNWESLFVFDGNGARLRFPDAPHEAHALWERIRSTSPPPFIVRAFAGSSKLATQVAIAMSRLRTPDLNTVEPDELRWSHLQGILQAARDDMQARGGQLAVVVLPLANNVLAQKQGEIAERMVSTAEHLGIPTFDSGPLMREAAARGESLFLSETDTHFSVRGNELLAGWLRQKLPTDAKVEIR